MSWVVALPGRERGAARTLDRASMVVRSERGLNGAEAVACILDRYAGHHAQRLVTAQPNDEVIYGDRFLVARSERRLVDATLRLATGTRGLGQGAIV